MRLAYIGEFGVPSIYANSVQVMKMCDAFARLGHRVTLLIPGEEEDIEQRAFSFYGMEPSFEIRALSSRPLDGWPHAYAWRVAGYVHRMKPDAVYGRALYGCAATAALGVPTALEVHHPVTGRIAPRVVRFLAGRKAFSHIVAISGALRDYCIDHLRLVPENTIAAHDGADAGEMRFSPPVRPVERVGYVGHLYPGRGIDVILALAMRFPELTFHIVGGARKDVEGWKDKVALPNVVFHGHVAYEKVPALYADMDVLLAPYQRQVTVGGGKDTARWMSPLKIFEYMASVRPVICSDLPVLHEVHEPGKTALLVPPDDVNAWAAALRSLMDDPALRRRLTITAWEKLKREFTWTVRAERVLAPLVERHERASSRAEKER